MYDKVLNKFLEDDLKARGRKDIRDKYWIHKNISKQMIKILHLQCFQLAKTSTKTTLLR